MHGALDWMRDHAAVVAGIAVVVIAAAVVGAAAALGVFSSKAETPKIMPSTEATAEVSLSVVADAGWTADSTPAIVHVEGADENTAEVDFYHAIAADEEEGNKGSSKVKLTEGSYTVSFYAPVNADGSTFSIDATVATQSVNVDAGSDAPAVECSMVQIPADQVTDEMLQAAVANLRTAVDLGDETLKGNAGRDILAKMEANIANNPNVSDETKDEAERVEEEADVDSTPVSTLVTMPYAPSAGGYAPSAPSDDQGGSQNEDGPSSDGAPDTPAPEPSDPGQGDQPSNPGTVDPAPGGGEGGETGGESGPDDGGDVGDGSGDTGEGGGTVDPGQGGGTEGGGDQGGSTDPGTTPPVDPGAPVDPAPGGDADMAPGTSDAPAAA